MERDCNNCIWHTSGSCANWDCEYVGRHEALEALRRIKEMNEILRCKNCRYWQDNNGGYPHEDCKWKADETPDPDDYCSFAKRRVEG